MLISLVIPSPSMEGIAPLNESGSQANEDRIGSTSGSRIGGLGSAHSVAFQRLGRPQDPVAGPLWRAHNPAGHLERLLEQIVQEREVLHVRAGLGRRGQVDVQLGKGMRAQRGAVGLGQGGDPQALH